MYVVEMAERLDTMSRVKLGDIRFQLEASCVSCHTEDLKYKETVCGWRFLASGISGLPYVESPSNQTISDFDCISK